MFDGQLLAYAAQMEEEYRRTVVRPAAARKEELARLLRKERPHGERRSAVGRAGAALTHLRVVLRVRAGARPAPGA